MIAYKVVTETSYGIFSAIPMHRYAVEYKIGEETLPHPGLPGSCLFVFKTLEDAKEFSNGPFYECEIDNPTPSTQLPESYTEEEFWGAFNSNSIENCFCYPAPQGTLFVKSVKLIKEVK